MQEGPILCEHALHAQQSLLFGPLFRFLLMLILPVILPLIIFSCKILFVAQQLLILILMLASLKIGFTLSCNLPLGV